MKTSKILLPVLGMFLFMNACKKDEPVTTNTASGTSPVSVRMTDAPGNYEEVNIDIREVRVHAEKGGWVTLDTRAGIYNILNLTNGLDTLLGSANIPNGKISEVRLILGPNNTVKVNGLVYQLETPSAEHSGLKLKIHHELLDSNNRIILLDFDAGKSIKRNGNGTYRLSPVLRHIKHHSKVGIDGTIVPAFSHPNILTIHGTDTVSTYSNKDGHFCVKDLSAGTYSVVILPNGLYKDTTFANVTVTAGNVTHMGLIKLHQ